VTEFARFGLFWKILPLRENIYRIKCENLSYFAQREKFHELLANCDTDSIPVYDMDKKLLRYFYY